MHMTDSDNLTPEAEALLNSIRAQGFPGWAFLTIAQTRAMMTGLKARAGKATFAGSVEDIRISESPDITARRIDCEPPA
jgi:hypothetical protein